MTYLKLILEILSDELITINEIIKRINVNKCKMTYIISALKKGICEEKLRMVMNPNVKLKYQGHLYSLNPIEKHKEISDSNILFKELRGLICDYV